MQASARLQYRSHQPHHQAQGKTQLGGHRSYEITYSAIIYAQSLEQGLNIHLKIFCQL